MLCYLGKYFRKKKYSYFSAPLSPHEEAAWPLVLSAFTSHREWEKSLSCRVHVLVRGSWAREALSLALQILRWCERIWTILKAQNREDASL